MFTDTLAASRSRLVLAGALVLAAAACAGEVEPIDRTSPPVLGAPPAVKLPPVVRKDFPNGLQVFMVEHHELPVVNFVMVTESGAESDPPSKGGLATLTAALLDEGTTKRTALEIADQVAFLGASLSTSSGWDLSSVSMQSTTDQLDSALAIFAEVIQHPSFPEDEFDRLRRERLTSLLQVRDNPVQIAEQVFSRVVFGENNPYGNPVNGTEASVQSLTVADVQAFYSSHFRPNNSTLIVVGDFEPARMEAQLQSLFGGWEKAEVPQVTFAAPPERTGTTIYLVDKPGAAQSSIRIGHVGVKRATDDYFALIVANTVLGGSFTSRLNMNLRETKGWTYGASSRFQMRKSPGPFVASAEIVTAMTDSAILEFMKELKAAREPVPSEELTKAKQYVQLQLPARFEATGDIASQLIPIALYDLPLDYYNSYVQSIDAISPPDAASAMERQLHPDRFAIVVVGDRQVVEPALRRLNLGEISIRNISGAVARE